MCKQAERTKIFFSVEKKLTLINDNESVEETTGHKVVTAYTITDGDLVELKSITIPNYKSSREEIEEAIEVEHGKLYIGYEYYIL